MNKEKKKKPDDGQTADKETSDQAEKSTDAPIDRVPKLRLLPITKSVPAAKAAGIDLTGAEGLVFTCRLGRRFCLRRGCHRQPAPHCTRFWSDCRRNIREHLITPKSAPLRSFWLLTHATAGLMLF